MLKKCFSADYLSRVHKYFCELYSKISLCAFYNKSAKYFTVCCISAKMSPSRLKRFWQTLAGLPQYIYHQLSTCAPFIPRLDVIKKAQMALSLTQQLTTFSFLFLSDTATLFLVGRKCSGIHNTIITYILQFSERVSFESERKNHQFLQTISGNRRP